MIANFQKRVSEQGWPNLFLRVVLGFGFFMHGWAKLSRGVDIFGDNLAALSVPFPAAAAWLTTWLELVGGLMLVAGFCVELISLPLIVTMLVAMTTVHWQFGFSSIKLSKVTATGLEFGPPGYELNLIYIVGLVVLMVSGPGRYSLTGALLKNRA